MPEQGLGAFTAATDGVDTADVFHLQRKVAGDWQDFQANSTGLYGVPVETVTVASLSNTANTTLLPAPASGTMYVILSGHVKYTPGATNDSAVLNVSFDGNHLAAANFANAKVLCDADGSAGIVSPVSYAYYDTAAALKYTKTGATTSDGTVSLWLQYFQAEWP